MADRRSSGSAEANGERVARHDDRRATLRRYLVNCGLLLLPIVAWNAAFTGSLPTAFAPATFWNDIPAPIVVGENALRIAVFALPFLMPLDQAASRQSVGMAIYGAGMLIYFGAWLPLMLAPASAWSTSLAGFAAPAVTPLLWLAGIGLIGRELHWPSPYRRWHYLALSAAFVAFHVSHTVLIYRRAAILTL